MFLTKRFIATLAVAATSFATGADADSFEPYAPNAFANPSMNPCCGNGTGDSGCRYFDFEGICGRQVCDSCADVPCGQCQQGCERSDCEDYEDGSTRSACKIRNYNQFPSSCVDSTTGDSYEPSARIYSTAHICCGNGTGDSGCRYFDFEGICGRQVCDSCADVPCGQCQQDCPRSDCTAAERESTGSNTRNACQDQEDQTAQVPNFGYFPNSCAKRFAVGSYNTVCGQNQLMSYQECKAAAMQKIVGSSARVRIVGKDKQDKFPAGCSFKLKNNGKSGAFYNAKWQDGSEHDWQQTGKPGRAHKKFQPVCLEQ